MPTCGNCKSKGVSVAHIRHCYGVGGADLPSVADHAAVKQSLADAVREVDAGPLWPASDKQIDYVIGLQLERNLPDDYQVKDRDELARMERDQVSGLISLLKTFSRVNHDDGSKVEWTMPNGRYALEDDGVWRFYQVDKPTEGRWVGYIFVNQLIGAPGKYRKEPIKSPNARNKLLRRIEDDPKKAMVDYGLHSEVCGLCSSPLSDKESLARGLGPICAGKSGWF